MNKSITYLFRRFVILLTLITATSPFVKVYGQDCDVQIDLATTHYNDGQLELVLEALKDCKNSGNDVIHFGVHSLLAKTQLALNNNALAKASAKELLSLNPNYRPSVIDNSSEFIGLINSITVIPKFSLGVSFSTGTSLSLPQVFEIRSITEHTKLSYKSKPGVMFGTSASYQMNAKLALKLDVLYQTMNFEMYYPTAEQDLNNSENIRRISFPIGFMYLHPLESRFTPFVNLGGYGASVLSSRSSFYYQSSRWNESYALQNINTTENRTAFNYGLYAGFGTYYKYNKGLISTHIIYQHALNDHSLEDQAYSNLEIQNNFLHRDDVLRLHSLSFMIGYHRVLKYKVL